MEVYDELEKALKELEKKDKVINDLLKRISDLEFEIEKQDKRIDKAIEYITKSMNKPQPFYEYLYGDENGEIENLDKLLNILKGEDKE